jgi:hypothetical protein
MPLSNNTANTEESTNDHRYVSISTMIVSGGAVFAGAAALVGTAHWHSTAKQLKAEGISSSARQRALPLGCVAVGGMAAVAFSVLGGEYKGSTSIGSFSKAMELVKEQRDFIRDQFQRIVSGESTCKSKDQIVKDVAKE